jgi:hypothetical protein
MIRKKMRPKEPIPEFASREEEARFWDTHDLADYWGELRPVKVRFSKNLSEGLHIRLDPETMGSCARRQPKGASDQPRSPGCGSRSGWTASDATQHTANPAASLPPSQ